jgi:hypothetical protein
LSSGDRIGDWEGNGLRLSLNWRGINAPNQLRLLLAGRHFQDGRLVLGDAPRLERAVGA